MARMPDGMAKPFCFEELLGSGCCIGAVGVNLQRPYSLGVRKTNFPGDILDS
jgi:hypothetical protein